MVAAERGRLGRRPTGPGGRRTNPEHPDAHQDTHGHARPDEDADGDGGADHGRPAAGPAHRGAAHQEAHEEADEEADDVAQRRRLALRWRQPLRWLVEPPAAGRADALQQRVDQLAVHPAARDGPGWEPDQGGDLGADSRATPTTQTTQTTQSEEAKPDKGDTGDKAGDDGDFDAYLTTAAPVETKSAPVWVVPGILLVLTSMLALLGGVLGRGRGARPVLARVKTPNENPGADES